MFGQWGKLTYSRMLDSEGWAMMYGGGFSEMVLYSRFNYVLVNNFIILRGTVGIIPAY